MLNVLMTGLGISATAFFFAGVICVIMAVAQGIYRYVFRGTQKRENWPLYTHISLMSLGWCVILYAVLYIAYGG